MDKESYADFSIIHKYFQQEKLHEEEMQRYKDQVNQENAQAQQALKEVEGQKDSIQRLTEENEELKRVLQDKENEISRLNGTITNLNKKIAAVTKGGRL